MVIEVNHRKVDRTNTKRFGGFCAYWKLYYTLIKTAVAHRNMLTVRQMLNELAIILLKTPWWLLIKPLGCLFSSKIRTVGEYRSENGSPVFSKEKITVIWRFIGIPFFGYIKHKEQSNSDVGTHSTFPI